MVGYEEEHVHALINFIYFGHVEVTNDNAFALLMSGSQVRISAKLVNVYELCGCLVSHHDVCVSMG